MTTLRREDGVTLPELLVGMGLLVIVMLASLGVLDQVTALSKRTDRAVDLQDAARATSRQLARSLRNVVGSPDSPGVVERSQPYDLVFRAVDKARADMGANANNVRRVRYCLEPAGIAGARLVEQTQRWTSATALPVPAAAECPGGGWDATRFVANRLTNRAGGLERPLWTYGRTSSGQIVSLKLNLFMNERPKVRAREVALQTGVFLRNQNRVPSAMFTATVVGVRHVLLNGAGSSDPESQQLEYRWYANGVEVGRGLVFDYRAQSGGTHVIALEVRDPGGLSDRSPAVSVAVG